MMRNEESSKPKAKPTAIRWKDSRQFSVGFDGDVADEAPCLVVLRKDKLIVSYIDSGDGKRYEYHGPNDGNGHFNPTGQYSDGKVFGRARLHMATDANDEILEGTYSEDGYDGLMWSPKSVHPIKPLSPAHWLQTLWA